MTPLDRATSAAADLLRTSLVARLAVDLEDPQLARRAAREAGTHARLLRGMDFPPYRGEDPLPELDDLLERMPSRRDLEETP